ncbi:hypothetical protein ACJ72_08219 [Emergomyces africanus]|uniref:non-specific serine/threonine protein kinase n=1 Tax=Emergomyces africanus TaxID=1955775 RepID=A0A1B7NL29_9EURO|nr:hypothetical protein ACJ72_08219 [Emergomyces africanus]
MAITAAAPQYPKGNDMADFGDFVSTEDEELDLEEVVEPWHKYDIKETPHVFYPIRVGEVLNDRYLIEHKIGSGGFSTVWMAHDLQDKRDVALKVMSSGEWALPEQWKGLYTHSGGLDSWYDQRKTPIQIMTLHQQLHTFVPKLIQLSENMCTPLCLEYLLTGQRNV